VRVRAGLRKWLRERSMLKAMRLGLLLPCSLVAACSDSGDPDPLNGLPPSDQAAAERLVGTWWGEPRCKGVGQHFQVILPDRPEIPGMASVEFTRGGQICFAGSARATWKALKVEGNAVIVQLSGKCGSARRVSLIFASTGRVEVKDPGTGDDIPLDRVLTRDDLERP
jgi:hypothetical protein